MPTGTGRALRPRRVLIGFLLMGVVVVAARYLMRDRTHQATVS